MAQVSDPESCNELWAHLTFRRNRSACTTYIPLRSFFGPSATMDV